MKIQSSHVSLRDVGLALLLVTFGQIGPLTNGPSIIDGALAVCAAAAPFTRWRWPLLTVGVAVAPLAACAFQPELPIGTVSVVVFTAYIARRHLSSPLRDFATVALLSGVVIATTFISAPLVAMPFSQRVPYIAWSVTLLVVGLLMGELRRRAIETAEKDMQFQLERQRDEFERASAEQRAHLAREIHDVVTHSLTVIVAQADGALYGSDRDGALRTISTVSRESLRQMRGVVGLLRDPDPRPLTPLSTKLDIDELVTTSRAGGLDVSVNVSGEQPTRLDPATSLTVHRIVQEALTNALKHGDGHAHLTVSWAADEVDIRVDNRFAPGARPGPGHGLPGMRERASLINGSLSSAPAGGNTWVMNARLPLSITSEVR
ncbi:two-component sensor histidine kinase [Corynebacterium sp. CCUG 71335]|uniref:sensor histidine kinase n=1 Tax=Corynebacterium sp. CCUG 71335 TaxID=2823892 RepID=UPI00210EDB7F|nr:histidine kinase [Corynebacterium sp. CCUG 71335]MCQ4620187.1 two-component sensor histidine kinase [Corynebacterium sp. CCUG 71335]